MLLHGALWSVSATVLASVLATVLAAQAAPVPPAQPTPEVSVVTVFGRLPKRVTSNVRRLDRRSASSCAFDANASALEMMDEYLDHFHGRGADNDGTEMAPVPEGDEDQEAARDHGFRDTSPYGDAARNGAARPKAGADGRMDPCSQADRTAAAGRNFIARKDQTLTRAFALYDKGDFAPALAAFETAWRQVGWDEAALMVGDMHLNGQGVPADPVQAARWYTRLADARTTQAHLAPYNPAAPDAAPPRVEAIMRLVRMRLAGLGVAKDPVAARALLDAAEALNYIPARHRLARMLLDGVGGRRDPARAGKLLASAADYGYAPAQWTLARMFDEGAGAPRDARQAFGWYQQAAFNPHPDAHKPHAQLALARMIEHGDGAAADPARALAFYKLAAVAGHPDAQNALGTYFYQGEMIRQDLPLARKLFIAAASQGQGDAMMNAGVMLFKGEGGVADPVQAYVWLRLAERVGHLKAAPMAGLAGQRLDAAQRAQAEAVLAPAP